MDDSSSLYPRSKTSPCLQILPPRRSNPRPEHRAGNLHICPVEGIHDGLDPVLVDLGEEVPDSFLGGRGGRVRGDRGGADGGGGRGGLVEQEELGVCWGDEGGDVVVEEAVYVLEVPAPRRLVSVILASGTGGFCPRLVDPVCWEVPRRVGSGRKQGRLVRGGGRYG